MNTIDQIILTARDRNCSDIHITAGMSVIFRIDGRLADSGILLGEGEGERLILSMADESMQQRLSAGSDLDFALQASDGGRQRVNVFRQQGKLAATIRLLSDHIPSLEELNLPPVLKNLADQPRGLILVTGPTGSGKSTTLAAMIDYINGSRAEHIITIEDPVEYVYRPKLSLIHQREVGQDVHNFAEALRSSLREDPDVILVGEMRDYETISAALTAAETGHLVLSTLHTTGAAQTIDRIIDACPPAAQNQVRTQLAGILKGVITQCLIPLAHESGRCAATEVLLGTDAALNLIRENKCHQLNTTMQSGAASGMHTLNGNLSELVRKGRITRENAFRYSNDRRDLEQYL
ncbi:type IV pilus twitching motility protein PilT [Lachnotalea sp. AF33-28]|uniref:type IV pilus twitching motility protein PilT n=1 Tax=Lachnotalea sp. AF33-28 TaxID=2292046 RepID=UPI000E5334AF|nr:type IV pilus twitching motility protein PilT [Lachnotalea sp. AF33-28]RHP30280.1 type IV pilus twitching motility protein PilT [Lachnotalea sp. AF33-28]